ncbi:Homeobox domain containing protein [Reticulomyxa filosa]|uniref:Homeobox domain containing protein n=1 Tax=Reticulomyxa filosa TaxID=46433 RepID=X6NUX2_RETFI|nr:Homeobox domain containing protein [Reticulomyxa filosa]|eukprot:ETO29067.1 Homeobox domain containing protein [Reticulomyxa filosa]
MQHYMLEMEMEAKIQERKYFNYYFNIVVKKTQRTTDGVDVSDNGWNMLENNENSSNNINGAQSANDDTNSEHLTPLSITEPGDVPTNASPSAPKRKKHTKKPKFSEYDVRVFTDWYNMHPDNPYPSKREKQFMADLTNLTRYQVSRWFCNARIRKPVSLVNQA